MIQYLLDKFEHIQKQRNLYCANIKNAAITVKPSGEEPAVNSTEQSKILSKKTIFIYDFICENTQGKGPTTK